jgi:long-subunit acyl-CoA synthetase (AMP-forming)
MTDVVIKQLGFDRCRYFVSGAAPISTEVLEYFMSLNMPIHEIYGMSETSGVITLSDPFSAIDKFCGEPVKNIDLVIDPSTSEILVRGPMVFGSYYNYTIQPNSSEFNKDGYFKTGDCGTLIDGKLKIIGRLKELIITAGGENIPPIIIESRIRTEICANSNGIITFEPQLMVVGDRQKYLTLVVFNGEDTQIADRMVGSAVESYNTSYANSNSQKIQKYVIIREALTIESGLLTPTMKVKRAAVVKHYTGEIQKMYGADYAQI